MNIIFKEVQEAHLSKILDIYRHYVLNTTATFHAAEPSLHEMRELVFLGHRLYRTFVIFDGEHICGYVILARHKKREAYGGTAEVSIYLRQEYVGKGIGSLAIRYIEDYAASKCLHVLIATICGENSKSINLFQRNGYEKCAHYKETGKKFGRYLDVVAYQKILSYELKCHHHYL